MLTAIALTLLLICLCADSSCPVSSMVDTLMDGLLSFPEEIFSKNLSTTQHLRRFNCSTSGSPISSFPYSCLAPSPCPLDDRQLDLAVESGKNFSQLHSLCRLRESLRNPVAIINVVVLGGSVTAGAETTGCCCSNKTDSKCVSEGLENPFCGSEGGVCSWSMRFSRWLRSRTPFNNINFHNLGDGGSTSKLMAEVLADRLKSVDISELHATDIVFIDHSFNDGLVFEGRKHRRKDLEQGLDILIRRIYALSANGSWPTVILLETYPQQNGDWSYSSAYKLVAERYSLPLWSIRSIVRSVQLERDYPQLWNLSNLKLVRRGDHHPNWIVHLWYADIIASLLVREMDRCLVSGGSWRSRPSVDMTTARLPPLDNSVDDSYCDPHFQPAIHLVAQDVAHQRAHVGSKFLRSHPLADLKLVSSTSRGSLLAFPNTSWPLLDHGKNKFAWTSVFPHVANESAPPVPHVLQVVARAEFSEDLRKASHVFKLHYLRTYENAGKAEVYFCGQFIKSLDALWPDYNTFRFSFQEVLQFERNPFMGEICASNKSTLEIRHGWVPPSTPNEKVARGLQKFSISSVKVCRIAL